MKIINKKIIKTSIITIFILQIILIAHRLSFDFNLLINFYKKDYGIKESLQINSRFKPAIEIKNIIKIYNIKDFRLSNELKNSIAFTRIIELNYPVKFKKNSKNYFSNKKEFKSNCNLINSNGTIYFYECGK